MVSRKQGRERDEEGFTSVVWLKSLIIGSSYYIYTRQCAETIHGASLSLLGVKLKPCLIDKYIYVISILHRSTFSIIV